MYRITIPPLKSTCIFNGSSIDQELPGTQKALNVHERKRLDIKLLTFLVCYCSAEVKQFGRRYNWELPIQNVIIAPATLDLISSLSRAARADTPLTQDELNQSFCRDHDCSGLPDSGNPGITLPSSLYDAFYAAIAASGIAVKPVGPGAGFTPIACDAQGPQLVFQINNNLYSLLPADYIENVSPFLKYTVVSSLRKVPPW